jgi:hypothetical protein
VDGFSDSVSLTELLSLSVEPGVDELCVAVSCVDVSLCSDSAVESAGDAEVLSVVSRLTIAVAAVSSGGGSELSPGETGGLKKAARDRSMRLSNSSNRTRFCGTTAPCLSGVRAASDLVADMMALLH